MWASRLTAVTTGPAILFRTPFFASLFFSVFTSTINTHRFLDFLPQGHAAFFAAKGDHGRLDGVFERSTETAREPFHVAAVQDKNTDLSVRKGAGDAFVEFFIVLRRVGLFDACLAESENELAVADDCNLHLTSPGISQSSLRGAWIPCPSPVPGG